MFTPIRTSTQVNNLLTPLKNTLSYLNNLLTSPSIRTSTQTFVSDNALTNAGLSDLQVHVL